MSYRAAPRIGMLLNREAIVDDCYTDQQMTECSEIMRLRLITACHHYQFISGRQRPHNHC